MKKILIYGAAIAAIAGCSAKEETTDVKVFDASCEKVAVFEQGDMIVKCPTNETFASLQEQEANGMFVPHDDFNVSELAEDAENVYVNVIPAGAYDWAVQKEYRIMVKNPTLDGTSFYTVSVVVQE
ncbi:MAG: hypothetical protein J6T27_01390 [Alphaproteobacteria bacterium]|nr:hypothetical protein [Alphaproteobacteria bacterium]